MAEDKEYRGYNGTIVLKKDSIIIKRGIKGFMLGGGMLRGDKTIPYSSIVAVQFKKAGMTAGYLQLTLKGGSEAKGGLLQSTTDENSIHFHRYKNNNALFEEAKTLIEKRMGDQQKPQGSAMDELEKLAKLKDKGVITEEEFQAKKRILLDL